MSTRVVIAFVATLTSSVNVSAQTDPRDQLLRAIRFGEVHRAQLERDCRSNPTFSSLVQLEALCAKRHRIPLEVSEEAAAPFLKGRMSADSAKDALRFWDSDVGRSLSAKIVREIEAGKYDQLSEAERQLAKDQDQTTYGTILLSIANDREVGRAVARALFAYEPEAPPQYQSVPRRR